MICTKCNFSLAPGVRACPRCGRSVAPRATGSVYRSRTKRRSKGWVVLVLILAAVVAFNAYADTDIPTAPETPETPVTHVTDATSDDNAVFENDWTLPESTVTTTRNDSTVVTQHIGPTDPTTRYTTRYTMQNAQILNPTTRPTAKPTTKASSAATSVKGFPDPEIHYFSSRLTGRMRQNVVAIYKAVTGFQKSCVLPVPVSSDEVRDLLYILRYDCPELMQLQENAAFNYTYAKGSKKAGSFEIPYALSKSQYANHFSAVEKEMAKLDKKVKNLSDAQKQKYIYDYLVSTNTYNFNGQYSGSPYGVLINKQGKCDGFAFTIKWALNRWGIECIAVCGDPKDKNETIGHAWNVVKVNGTWVDLDVNPEIQHNKKLGWPAFYGIYNTPAYNQQNFKLRSAFTSYGAVPGSDSLSLSYHKQNGTLVAAGGDWKAALERAVLLGKKNGNGVAILQFSNASDMKKCNNGLNAALQEIVQKQNLFSGGWSWKSYYYNSPYVIGIRLSAA